MYHEHFTPHNNPALPHAGVHEALKALADFVPPQDGEDDEVAGDPDGGDRRHDHAVDEAAREIASLKHHRHR